MIFMDRLVFGGPLVAGHDEKKNSTKNVVPVKPDTSIQLLDAYQGGDSSKQSLMYRLNFRKFSFPEIQEAHRAVSVYATNIEQYLDSVRAEFVEFCGYDKRLASQESGDFDKRAMSIYCDRLIEAFDAEPTNMEDRFEFQNIKRKFEQKDRLNKQEFETSCKKMKVTIKQYRNTKTDLKKCQTLLAMTERKQS